MTNYQKSLRSKVARDAKLKLSVHREKGIRSQMTIFEVAELMDQINRCNRADEKEQSIFFSMSLN